MSETPEEREQRKRVNNRDRQRRLRARRREAIEIDDGEMDIVLDADGEFNLHLKEQTT